MTGRLIRLESANRTGQGGSPETDIDSDAWWSDLPQLFDVEGEAPAYDDCPEAIWPACEWLPLAGPDWEPVEWWDAACVVQETPVSAARAVFYVDADNQSSQCAAELVSLFGAHPGVRGLSAVIAGNNSGSEIDAWARELRAADPQIEIRSLHVPRRSQAADVALIMELGARLEGHAERGDLLVVVSRDDLLVGAAEHAKARGCRAVAAYADSAPPAARSSRVATILLPAVEKTQLQVAARSFPVGCGLDPLPSEEMIVDQGLGPQSDPALVLAALRTLCRRNCAGLYPAGEVGQALATLGFDAKARSAFLASVPGIRAKGKASKKAYRF